MTLIYCATAAQPMQLPAPAAGGEMSVEWNVPVSSPPSEHLNWFDIKADPEDKDRLIVCGARWSPQQNAYYGVVYFSRSGGRSWKVALEDRNSTWVSEHSCAYGINHHAYFVSEASRVIDGVPHHDLGTTRIFVSSDGGETWNNTATTEWADYSTSVVGKSGDARQLYVVYNSRSQYDVDKKFGATLDFFTVSENGVTLSARHSVPDMAKRNYLGVYPSSSLAINDGTPVVLFEGFGVPADPKSPRPYDLGVVRFSSHGGTSTTLVANPLASGACPTSIADALAYDSAHDVLYVTYNDLAPGHCAAMLTSSRDGGQTWSTPRELSDAHGPPVTRYFPVAAVNKAGTLGIVWRAGPRRGPDCWFLSVSYLGLTLDETEPLSPCAEENTLKRQSTQYLSTVIHQSEGGHPASVRLISFRDSLYRMGIATTSDDVFHPLWMTIGNGEAELRTARVKVGGSPSSMTKSTPIEAAQLGDSTAKIAILYGGRQRLDHLTNSVTLDLAVRNDSATSLAGPIYLRIVSVTSEFGEIELVNPKPTPLGRDYVDISSALHSGVLTSGERSDPFPLTFHFIHENRGDSADVMIDIKVIVFSQK